MKVRLRDYVVYWAARSVIGLAAVAPQWIGYGFAAWLGRTYFRCSKRRQQCALRFLRQAFPDRSDAELLRIGRVSTGNFFKVPIDMARLTRWLERGRDLKAVVDTSAVEGALPEPPYLVAAAHLGSWEVGAVAMAQIAGEAHAIARVSKNPLLQQWILNNRQRGGLYVHPRRGGIRPLARAVQQGAIGLQAVDQHQRLRGVQATFFGRMASCERAAASLALRHGYSMVVGGAVRVGRGFRFRVVREPTITFERTGDRELDLRNAVEAVNRGLERMLRAHPEQYLWIHDRYRDRGAAASPQPAVGQH
ncbi:MAG: hypothetical protein VYE77_03975 [Planctomycetota bacterium]|nr:hypothetical protein [Planctomycetota bacterium]